MVSNRFAALTDEFSEEVQPVKSVTEKAADKKAQKALEARNTAKIAPSRFETEKKREDRHKPRQKEHGRQFDRHSGTGRGKEVRKGGAGAHGWGEEKPELKGEEAMKVEETVAVEGATEETAEVVPAEPKIETVTVDAYLKKVEVAKVEVAVREVDDSAYEGKTTKHAGLTIADDLAGMMVSKTKKHTRARKVVKEETVEVGFRTAPRRDQREDRDTRDRKPRTTRRVPGEQDKRKGVAVNDRNFPALE